MKRSERRTEPCGTPERITNELDVVNPTRLLENSSRLGIIHSILECFQLIPYSSKFGGSVDWRGTLSKAFAKSKKTESEMRA